MPVSVYVRNEDGSISNVLTFTVVFGIGALQSWTTVEAVCGEVPQFKRGGTITDRMIEGWMVSITQTVNAAMVGRGLSLDPADWQRPAAGSAQPSPAAVLELIVRYGAGAKLATVVASQFSTGKSDLAQVLRDDFREQMKALNGGNYDKIFRPAAATQQTDQQFGGGDISTSGGEGDNAFSKDQTF
jgi:hypothetical protein